jgi:SWI/SNF-related matrix-associated actin-dependent regulator of chromatin subfamily A-like protein 1
MKANKFAGKCVTCDNRVDASAGFIKREDNRWVVYCVACVPDRKVDEERKLTKGGRVFMPYEPDNIGLVRTFPGAKFCGEEKPVYWQVSLEEQDRIRVLEIADSLALDVDPDLRINEEMDGVTAMAQDAGLYPFQVAGVQWLNKRKRAILGDDMGLGKTVQTLYSLDYCASVLVVCPSAVKYNWAEEVERWTPHFNVHIIRKKSEFRLPESASEIVIVSYDMLPKHFEDIEVEKGKWESQLSDTEKDTLADVTLVCDEAHKVSNWKSLRSRRVKGLGKACEKVWFLTGTPLLNHPPQLFGILSAGDMVQDTFGGWSKFTRCFNAYKGRFGWNWGQPTPEVSGYLHRVMKRRMKSEVMTDLPPKTFQTLVVDGANSSLIKELDAAWEEWKDVITSELPPFEEFSLIRKHLANAKIPAMLEYVESAEEQDTKLVVASAHRGPIDALAKRDGWEVITGNTPSHKRQEICNRLNNGELKGVGLTITAGGTGLNLVGASTMLFVDVDWTPANNIQCQDRICRIGQTSDNILIATMVIDHVLERHIHDLIDIKSRLIYNAIDKMLTAKVTQSQSETEAEYLARMEAIENIAAEQEKQRAETDKQRAKERVKGLLTRERQRATLPELRLTKERKNTILDAMGYMLSVCDGAESRDDKGFNKPDSCITRILARTEFETANEWRTMDRILTRYHRQLSGRFPVLFEKDKITA